MRILVTGGAGFIGTRLMMHLRQQPWATAVTGLDLHGHGAGVIPGDVRNADAVSRAVRRVDAVVHLAALVSAPESVNKPVEYCDVNTQGTAVVAEACRAHGVRLVLASSAAVYGRVEGASRESAPLYPGTPYAASKAAAEAVVRGLQDDGGLAALALRFFNVYGPGQVADHPYASVVPRFVRAALREEPLTIRGGSQSRDFVHVDDVAELIGLVVQHKVESLTPVNVGTGVGTSIDDLARLVSELVIGGGGILPTLTYGDTRSGEIQDSRADTTRQARLFSGWQPRPLVSGLAETYDWYLKAQTTREALPWLTR